MKQIGFKLSELIAEKSKLLDENKKLKEKLEIAIKHFKAIIDDECESVGLYCSDCVENYPCDYSHSAIATKALEELREK